MILGDDVQSDNLNTSLIWLKQFQERTQRPLRVLHIGNIANNAYLNAKMLRTAGIEADVLCHAYYHVMACPEWEEVDIKHSYGSNDNYPRFSKKDLRNYQRPNWFVQGPLDLCIKFIKARDKNKWHQFIWWRLMSHAATDHKIYKIFTFLQRCIGFAKRRIFSRKPQSYNTDKLIEEFMQAFPSRKDQLTKKDFTNFNYDCESILDLFESYDIIQGYSIDPILCLLFSKKPYIAFEHGTLRTFISGDNPLHRLNALAYRKASHVFITNGDCLEHARNIGIENFSPIIHPTDVDQYRRQRKETKSDIKQKYSADVLLFCPLRHDWEIKGTHLHLHSFPLIREALQHKEVKLLLVSWGLEMDKSRSLIKELGCEKNTFWLPPLCREQLVSFMQAADVVLDQMALPCFGGTAPQSVAAGTPVIMSYKPESTEWIVKEPAPIIPAFSVEEVCQGVLQALDEDWLIAYKKRAQEWTDKEHSIQRVIKSHIEVYRKLIEQSSH